MPVKKKVRKDNPTSVRITPANLKSRAMQKAKEERRTLGGLICFLLEQYLEHHEANN